MRFEPTLRSLRHHQVPDWYHDAKLGVFVHWGLYSVPGWADHSRGSIADVMIQVGSRDFFCHNPYAEWYGNTMKLPDSATFRYHVETYGTGFAYDQFVPAFNKASAHWKPQAWADLFRRVGARYIVLTSKHHDGFLLWPSKHLNPYKKDYVAKRDIVGELAAAVRDQGLRMGLYYSGGLDWTFNTTPLRDIIDLITTMPQAQTYADYVDTHWREMIRRYPPAVLWNDIGFPARVNAGGPVCGLLQPGA